MKYLSTIIMIIQLLTGVAGCDMGRNSRTAISWSLAGKLPLLNGKQPGVAGACAGVHQGVMLVAGGANFPDTMPWLGGKKKYHDKVYAFIRDENGRFEPTGKIFTLFQPIAYAASVSTEQGIVCVGGENQKGILRDVFIMKWEPSSQQMTLNRLPPLPFPITNASITSNDHKIYVAGGEMPDSVSDDFLSLDLNDTASGWRVLPALPYPVSHAVLVFNGPNATEQIYLAGGRKRNAGSTSTFYKNLYAYDIAQNKWKTKAALPYPLSAGTGIANGHGLLIFGGDRGETFHRTELLMAAITSSNNAADKQQLSEQKTLVQSTHPGFSREVLQYDASENKWEMLDSIPFDVPVTTTVFRWEDDIIIPSGEIKAGVRTPFILAGKLTNKK